MYKPFVTDIDAMEKIGDMGLRFKLKQRQRHLPHRLAQPRST